MAFQGGNSAVNWVSSIVAFREMVKMPIMKQGCDHNLQTRNGVLYTSAA